MRLRQLPLIGFCASLSLIVSLFISNLAFIDENLQSEAKMGVLIGSTFGMIGGILYRIIFKNGTSSTSIINLFDADAKDIDKNKNLDPGDL